MDSQKHEVAIPARSSSWKNGTQPADHNKTKRKDIKTRELHHRGSQRSLDPLHDEDYRDRQAALKDCAEEKVDLREERSRQMLSETKGCVEDFREVSRSAARQKLEMEAEIDILARRKKLLAYIKESFLLVLSRAAND